MESNIDVAAISEQEEVILFNAIGIRTYLAKTASEVEKTIFQLVNQKCKIIYITEELFLSIPETIEKYKHSAFPIIIPMPFTEDNLNVGRKKIKENVEKAIGIDIF
jgi:V/A-type H+-transporting ATPase subunit F